MNLRRSRAYGRVVRALAGGEQHRLTPQQQDTIREAADDLLFASDFDWSVRLALASARAVLLSVRVGDYDQWVEQLADDLVATGPPPVDEPASLPRSDHQRARRDGTEQWARR